MAGTEVPKWGRQPLPGACYAGPYWRASRAFIRSIGIHKLQLAHAVGGNVWKLRYVHGKKEAHPLVFDLQAGTQALIPDVSKFLLNEHVHGGLDCFSESDCVR